MTDLIQIALNKGASIHASISGGKDGQAMVHTLAINGIPVNDLLHCDLGRTEWPQSLPQCEKQAAEKKIPLSVLRRKDGLDLLGYMKRRMDKLTGTGKPFWPSSAARYCTSDLKREPSNSFFRESGQSLIISAEGIRADESVARAKKVPLSIRQGITSSFYSGMSVEKALANYRPDKRLVLNWYPIFNMHLDEVWATYKMNKGLLHEARQIYRSTNEVVEWWPFHPAYVFGNDRVSCMMCILGCLGDLQNGKDHNPELYQELVQMEVDSGFTFKRNFSLTNLK